MDSVTSVRVTKAFRTVQMLGPPIRPNSVTPQERAGVIMELMNIGWPKILADIEYLKEYLPIGDPRAEGIATLLRFVRDAMARG